MTELLLKRSAKGDTERHICRDTVGGSRKLQRWNLKHIWLELVGRSIILYKFFFLFKSNCIWLGTMGTVASRKTCHDEVTNRTFKQKANCFWIVPLPYTYWTHPFECANSSATCCHFLMHIPDAQTLKIVDCSNSFFKSLCIYTSINWNAQL